MNIISNLIFHCNHCYANTAFITIHDSTAAASSEPSGLLNATFTFKGTCPTNHFYTDSQANECLINFAPDSFHTGVKAEALRAKIDRKSAISHQRGHFDPKFQVQRVAPTNNFCTIS